MIVDRRGKLMGRAGSGGGGGRASSGGRSSGRVGGGHSVGRSGGGGSRAGSFGGGSRGGFYILIFVIDKIFGRVYDIPVNGRQGRTRR